MKNNWPKLPKIFIINLLVVSNLTLSGCAVPKMRRSPYLQNVDLKGFHKHEYAKDFVMYSNPTSDWLKYNKFILSPVLVSINPTLEYQHLNPTALKLTSDILIEEVQSNLRQEFTETTTVSKNVVNIKLALTNMMAPSRKKEIGSMQAGLIPIGLHNAIFEAYFEDALSGELLAVVRDERIGLSNTTKFYKGFSSSNFFHHSFALWGTELCNILLEKTGQKRKDEIKNIPDEFDNALSEESFQSKEEYNSNINQTDEVEIPSETTVHPPITERASSLQEEQKIDQKRQEPSNLTNTLKEKESLPITEEQSDNSLTAEPTPTPTKRKIIKKKVTLPEVESTPKKEPTPGIEPTIETEPTPPDEQTNDESSEIDSFKF